MGIRRKYALCLLALSLLSGCVRQGASPSAQPEETSLSVAATFQREDGTPLQGGSARVSVGEREDSYPLDSGGRVRVPDLPRSGELLLTLLDRRQETQGTMTLSFAQAAVIDATTGEDGVGHITVRDDTEAVDLVFVLTEDGTLYCTLQLTDNEPYKGAYPWMSIHLRSPARSVNSTEIT